MKLLLAMLVLSITVFSGLNAYSTSVPLQVRSSGNENDGQTNRYFDKTLETLGMHQPYFSNSACSPIAEYLVNLLAKQHPLHHPSSAGSPAPNSTKERYTVFVALDQPVDMNTLREWHLDQTLISHVPEMTSLSVSRVRGKTANASLQTSRIISVTQ